jgi:hypothetical protein
MLSYPAGPFSPPVEQLRSTKSAFENRKDRFRVADCLYRLTNRWGGLKRLLRARSTPDTTALNEDGIYLCKLH